MIPYGRQDVSEIDVQAVVDVLRSDFLTQGPQVPKFEKAIAQYCGVEHAVAVNSATSALHIACLALGVGPGDLVWTSPITFVASANCALYCGGEVDFIDINPSTANIDVIQLEKKFIAAKSANRLPKVLVAVHLSGASCEMAKIHTLCQSFGVKIIEDASHAIGGKYQGSPVGSCRYSDITVFSFHPVKIITTAEGGLATSKSAELARKMNLLRSHGITRDESEMTHASDGPWYYQQVELGFNYRLTEIQAALGLAQMGRLDAFVQRRHELARRYDEAFNQLPLHLPVVSEGVYSALHLYIIRLNNGQNHLQVFNQLRILGVGVNLHYIPVYLQPYYAKMGFRPGYCPNAETFYGTAISIPMYSALTEADQNQVIAAVKQVVTH